MSLHLVQRDSSLLHILSTGVAQMGQEDLLLRRPARVAGRWVLPVPWGSARAQSHSSCPHGLCVKASPQAAQASSCDGGWVRKVAHLLSSDSRGGYIYPLLNRNKIKIFGDDVFELPWSIFSPIRDRKSRHLEHRPWGVL